MTHNLLTIAISVREFQQGVDTLLLLEPGSSLETVELARVHLDFLGGVMRCWYGTDS